MNSRIDGFQFSNNFFLLDLSLARAILTVIIQLKYEMKLPEKSIINKECWILKVYMHDVLL